MAEQARSFIGSVSLLALGGIISQAIGILALPVTSRLFPPEAFGIQTVFLSAAGILASFASLKYELAIMLPPDDRDAAGILALSMLILCIFTGITGVIVLISGEGILNLLHLPKLRTFLPLIPLGVFLTGGMNILNLWMLRRKQFGEVSGVRIAGKASQTSYAIGSGALGHGSGGALIVSSLLEAGIQTVLYSFSTARKAGILFSRLSFSGLKTIALRYIRFPLYTSWSGLLNTISLTAPAILVAMFFGMEAGGYYSRALALIQVPMFFLGDSIRDVFFSRAGSMKAAGEDISEFLDGIVRRVIGIILLPVLMVLLIGPEIFIVIAGKEWFAAGVYSRILTPWMFFGFISMPLGVLLYIHERQNVLLVYNILLIIARCVTLILGGVLHLGIETTLICFSLASAALSAWIVFYSLRLEKASLRRFLLHAGRYAAYSAPAVSLISLGKWYFHLSPLPMLILGIAVSASYWWLSLRNDPEIMTRASECMGRLFGSSHQK
jgi:O-antigen/teichoic acid export membrane protein